MWRPLSIFKGYPKLSEYVACFYPVSLLDVFDGVQAKVSIQCMKGISIHIMGEDDRGAIITKTIIKSKTMHDTIQRSYYLGVRLPPNIYSEVYASRFFFCIHYLVLQFIYGRPAFIK